MKVTFISNFLTHHQLPFCLEMQKRLGKDFKFISTEKIFDWRIKLGFKDLDNEYDFVIKAYESERAKELAKKLTLESDVAIVGSTTDKLLEERLKQDKLTFRYRARVFIFPDGFFKTLFKKEKLKLFYDRHIKFRKNKNLYMLCANAYGANDFYKLGLYKDKINKWGYFPILKKYDIEKLIDEKEKQDKINILWTSRFIEWKHPEYMVRLAKKLLNEGISNFKIRMLGNGVELGNIRRMVKEKGLEEYIDVIGAVDSDKVREYMEKANIFLFTSDRREGWGAVLNESMNSGCAVIANINIGSVPFLVKNNINGLVYENFSQFYVQVKKLINDKELRRKLSINAYKTIEETWNSKIATENLLKLFDSVINNKKLEVESGPASKAFPIKKGDIYDV